MKPTRLARRTLLKLRGRRGVTLAMLDDLLRQYVLKRDQGRCQVCVALMETHEGCRIVQVHHLKAKRPHPALRYEPLNVLLVGKFHHLYRIHGTDPDWWGEHKNLILGKTHIDLLDLLAMQRKGSRLDKQATKLYLEGLIREAATWSADLSSSQEHPWDS